MCHASQTHSFPVVGGAAKSIGKMLKGEAPFDAALANVSAGGGEVIPEKEEHDFGRFGWFVDPDGNRVELWEPPEQK